MEARKPSGGTRGWDATLKATFLGRAQAQRGGEGSRLTRDPL